MPCAGSLTLLCLMARLALRSTWIVFFPFLKNFCVAPHDDFIHILQVLPLFQCILDQPMTNARALSTPARVNSGCTGRPSKQKQIVACTLPPEGLRQMHWHIICGVPLGCLWFQFVLKHVQHSSTQRWRDFIQATIVHCQPPLSVVLSHWPYGTVKGWVSLADYLLLHLQGNYAKSTLVPFWVLEVPSPAVIYTKDAQSLWASHNGVLLPHIPC